MTKANSSTIIRLSLNHRATNVEEFRDSNELIGHSTELVYKNNPYTFVLITFEVLDHGSVIYKVHFMSKERRYEICVSFKYP